MELGIHAASSCTAASDSGDARPPKIIASVDGESMPAGKDADQPLLGCHASVCSNMMNRLRFVTLWAMANGRDRFATQDMKQFADREWARPDRRICARQNETGA